MASKIKGHSFYVAVAPYRAGANDETFNELDVTVSYDDYRKHFYVSLHAGWRTDWGGHGCIFLGEDNPLTAPKYVKVKDSPRNSQRTIDEMGAGLELAREAIAWLFNKRDWARLYNAVRNIALNGYSEQYRSQMEALMQADNPKAKAQEPVMKQVDVMGLMNALSTRGSARLSDFATPVETSNSNNESDKEDKDMRLNLNANKTNESANVQAAAPVNNPIEDAVAVEIKDEPNAVAEVEVAEVTDIIPPAPKKRAVPKAEQEPTPEETKTEDSATAVSVPLGKHGTLVVAGMPKRDKNGKFLPKAKAEPKPDPEAVGELAGMLTRVELVVYKTKKGADAPMIVGFSGEDDERWKKLYDAKPKWVSAGYRKDGDGDRQYHLMFGTRYMDVARALSEAYNTTDREAWEKAEKACAACYDGIVSGFKAEKEARKAERNASREAAQPAEPKTYTNEDVAEMLRRVLSGGDVPEDIKQLLKAA